VKPGDCFFAVPGTQSDGHDYIPIAVEKGAAAIVCERMPADAAEGVAYVLVGDSAGAMADMAAAFYDYPSRELKLVGITGTNGKTTTATLLYDLVRAMGYKAGLISTVVYKIDGREVEATHTTPDSIRLNAMMREMADAGCAYCFMECSSHAIVQQRTRGLHFAGGIFSNITHDHLDYHKTFAEYIRAKKLFFDNLPKEAFALINIDDRNGRVMVQNTRATVKTLSLQSMADFRCKILETHPDGMELRIDGREVWVHFLGRFNAYNLLCVYAAALLLGADREEVLQIMSTLHPVSGRFEFVRAADGTTAIVDYAHTPDALEKVLQTVEEIRRPGQQLFVLCGCGGDRDKTKRPEMAQIAVKYATTAILTSDNPRHEDPDAILDDMVAGLAPGDRYLRIADRAEAIRTAAMLAKPGDILLLAGKGHETYQIVGDVKNHFDDKEEALRAFALYAKN
jgi:UDP-N-acetylmuramoyl-L-alanyl-D-glutamate--2,6-diaminopimelate ligase